ncbi:hypothetical protein MTO96_050521 [Rhipicephalus appendiculatus]
MFSKQAVSQHTLDKLVTTFVVEGLHSFSIVEEQAFKDLVEHLAPGRKTLTRRMLTARLDTSFEDMKQKLSLELINVDHVVVSADLWSSFHMVFGESETNDTDDEDEIRPAELTGILNAPDGSECVLPPHIRCAAHTLNLVATSDSAAAEHDAQYSRISKSVFKKCPALWSKQGQSNISADLIKSHCGVYLRRPVPTRWNSLHDAMEHLLKLHNEGKDIERLFCILKLQILHRPAEYKFMEEYCNVMQPISCALDVLQRQEHMFIGYLLPTLAVLEKRIKYEAMKGLAYCGPLASAVLDGIEKRFGHLRGKRELVVASCLIPKFKLSWMPDSSMRDQASMNIRTELATVTQPARADATTSSAPEDFFSFGLQTLPAETQDELSRYLLVPGDYPPVANEEL